MNWFKAKNLILISLIGLNVFLLSLIAITNENYQISSAQIENTYQVLSSKYNIGIYAELPKKFEPMKEIEVINVAQEVSDYLYTSFMGDEEGVEVIQDEDKFIYKSDDKTLMTQSGDFVLTMENGSGVNQDEIITNLEKAVGEYDLYSQYSADGYDYYDYRQNYKGETIYTNYILIEELNGEVTRLEGYYAKPVGFIGDDRDIVSIDMVLLNFANFYPKEEDEQLFIDSVDLVYNQEQMSNDPDVILKVTPCYLITVRGNNIPVKIDAYTNTILTK